jgi:Nucleotidyl transferase AbiEii toxin, Type IV TA system
MNDESKGGWYHEDPTRFREALAFAETESGFSSRLIEKDYYCSLLLHDLSGLFQQGLVFKGGTCLSKVHAEFFRLSEDLDFCISLRPEATRSERRQAASPIKDHFAGVTGRLACFEEIESLAAHNESRQYIGQFAYRSAVTGERESIKVEVSLREENRLPTEILPARTLLRDPHSGRCSAPCTCACYTSGRPTPRRSAPRSPGGNRRSAISSTSTTPCNAPSSITGIPR